ncbi:MAG: hypothetical protein Q4A84_02585 [Neisseria sp.]|uniref:tetratricopeptide repeat protein n=1 Tax=Neisseria sp. TaxID=192066 RepID=UPI0026DB576B|nr:tetratricopeptide repeat protein [Neisseria sp.]MDO4640580.1 hypothetical protein [Neisseria sp.]
MFALKKRFHPLVLSVLLAYGASAFAADKPPKASDYRPVDTAAAQNGKSERRVINESEYERRSRVVKHANGLFTLLGGEMALQKGDVSTALATYMLTFVRTQDPAVAERAVEMALSLHAYREAEDIFQQWQKIEPQGGVAQQRMGWALSLATKDFGTADRDFDSVMSNADEESKRKLFLQLAQSAVENPDFAKRIERKVKRETKRYPDMPEAVITNAIFSSLSGDERGTVQALQRLTQLDTQIVPATVLTLRLIGQQKPEILNRFFAETDANKLSPMWRELQVEGLVQSGKYSEAYDLLQDLLKENPDADLYIQAALLAINQKAELPVILSYLEQAYKIGTQEQRSRAAVLAAMRNGDAHNYTAARSWAEKIKAPSYAFDKSVLSASIEAESGNWQKALAYVKAAQRLPEQQGQFFSDDDLFRVQIFTLTKHANPRQALQELNALYQKVGSRKNNREKLADVLYQRAILYADSLNEPQKAVADLRRYQELKPDSAEGMNALGYTMLSLPDHNVDEAFRLIQAAYQQVPDSAAVNDSLGWVYFLKGDTATALPYLEFAFGKQPEPEVASHLGEAYWKLGQRDKAKETFKKGLAIKEGKRSALLETIKRLGVSLP